MRIYNNQMEFLFFLKSITNNVRKLRIISNKSVYKHIVTISLVLNRRKPATSVAYTNWQRVSKYMYV